MPNHCYCRAIANNEIINIGINRTGGVSYLHAFQRQWQRPEHQIKSNQCGYRGVDKTPIVAGIFRLIPLQWMALAVESNWQER